MVNKKNIIFLSIENLIDDYITYKEISIKSDEKFRQLKSLTEELKSILNENPPSDSELVKCSAQNFKTFETKNNRRITSSFGQELFQYFKKHYLQKMNNLPVSDQENNKGEKKTNIINLFNDLLIYISSRSFTPSNLPPRLAAHQEFKKGHIRFKVLQNDPDIVLTHPSTQGTEEKNRNEKYSEKRKDLFDLVRAKNVFSTQLPRMPKEYVVRVVFDPQHKVYAMWRFGKLIGGVAYRPFYSQDFAEVVFCAVKSDEQVKGFGSLMMNHFKESVKKEGIRFLITYADNFAVGFFKKQGFSGNGKMTKEQFRNHIKHYDGSTLMECALYEEVDYTKLSEQLVEKEKEKRAEYKSFERQFRSFTFEESNTEEKLKAILDGIKESCGNTVKLEEGWWKELVEKSFKNKGNLKNEDEVQKKLNCKIAAVLKMLRNNKNVWPFLQPVDQKQVADYYQKITKAMDLSKITENFKAGRYATFKEFDSDFRLILDNCREYNAKNSNYVKCANELGRDYEEYVKGLVL